MQQHVHEKPFDVFAIGLGAELKEPQLEEIGKSGTAMATDRNAIVKAFDDIGGKVEQRTKSYYLLSYCSPSRAGQHVVRVEAVYKNPQGTDQTGSLESSFDATGFAPGCDPNTPPNFDVTRGEALVAAPVDKGDKPDKPEKGDKGDKGEKADKKVAKPEAKPAPPASKPEPKPAPPAPKAEAKPAPPTPKAAPSPAPPKPPPPAPPPAASPPPPPPAAAAPPPPPPKQQQDFNP
jgi:hypothetical protein